MDLFGIVDEARDLRDEWYTPINLIRALGPFDLDPACGKDCPNQTAATAWSCDGLCRPWFGRVWLNPPFSNARPWAKKMIRHGNGVLLVFARTDAAWFQQTIAAARGVFLLHGRVTFGRPGGGKGRCPLGCVLFPFGESNAAAIQRARLDGIWLDANK